MPPSVFRELHDALTWSRVAELLPFLVRTANALGLTVFDWAAPQSIDREVRHALPDVGSWGAVPKMADKADLRQIAQTAVTYAERRIGTKRISTRRFNAPAILRNIAKEWPS